MNEPTPPSAASGAGSPPWWSPRAGYWRGPRTNSVRDDLRYSTRDGICFTFMVGFAEVYLAAFVLRLGLGPIASGLILTVPMMLGAAIQLFMPPLLRRAGSYTWWVGVTAGAQALMYLPLAALALAAPFVLPQLKDAELQWVATVVVFVLVTIYFGAGLATGPAWAALTGKIWPVRIRSKYFANRSFILQWFMIAGILGHGLVMEGALAFTPDPAGYRPGEFDPILVAFAGVFVVGCVARLLSAYYLARYSEPDTGPQTEQPVRFTQYVARFKDGKDGRFLAYVLSMSLAAQIAQPFFNPYMLDVLLLNTQPMFSGAATLGPAYSWFLAATFVGRIVMLPIAGRIAHRVGPGRNLLIGGLALIPLPLIWLMTDNIWLLLLGQLVSGMAWAFWDLGSFLMIYEKVAKHERTSIMTYQTLMAEVTKTGGSLLGAAPLEHIGKDRDGYSVVFWASAVARLMTIALLLRVSLKPTPPAAVRTGLTDAMPTGSHPESGSGIEPVLTDPPTRSSRDRVR